jgi:SAM-dependent methyltransferase
MKADPLGAARCGSLLEPRRAAIGGLDEQAGPHTITGVMQRPDAPDHRKFVGPTEEYDLMGATQFSLLCALGLRAGHRLLDIGCGSLRAGRLFIPYLAPGGYTGLEPNRWLVEDALDQDLGHDLVMRKAATFVYNDHFDSSGLEPFDFVVAQSIASHTGPEMTRALIDSVRDALAPSGLAAVTFIHGRHDSTREGWYYTGTVCYKRQTVARWLAEAGLHAVRLRWYHPRQTWWAIAHQGAPLPPRQLRLAARGPMLPFRRSWDVAERVRHGTSARLPKQVMRRAVRR